MLTKHLTERRLLSATEQELQVQMEKRAHKKLRKKKAAAKTTAKRAAEIAEMETTLHTNAMLQHIADTRRNAALASRATEEEAHATSTTSIAMARAEHRAPMQT